MNRSADKTSWRTYLPWVLAGLVLLPLGVWNFKEIRSYRIVAKEHAHWKAIDEKEKSQISEMRSWEKRVSEVFEKERLENRRHRAIYKACLSKEDFFPLHPGKFYETSVDSGTAPTNRRWFYLPPGEHKLFFTAAKATEKDGEEHETKFAERQVTLTGGQVHELVLKRATTDTDCTYTCSLNEEVLVETKLRPAKKWYLLNTFQSNTSDSLVKRNMPYPINTYNLIDNLIMRRHGGVPRKLTYDQMAYTFRFRKEQQSPFPNYRLTYKDVDGKDAIVYFRFRLEFEGGPRADILDENFYHTTNELQRNAPFAFDEWFEHKDGLYFLRQEKWERMSELME